MLLFITSTISGRINRTIFNIINLKIKCVILKVIKKKEVNKMPENDLIKLDGEIESVIYNPQFKTSKLSEYDINDFNIKNASSYGMIKFNDESRLAYSTWVSPKRTRSFPLARVYSTYHAEKIVTIIPVLKDEGVGGDNDRINFITLSWLNLMNVYIILAWYDTAEKRNEKKITSQNFNNDYIIQKMKEIQSYKLDAHHWNQSHFEKEFSTVMENAIQSYKIIGDRLGVKLRDPKSNYAFLREIEQDDDKSKINLNKFKIRTLRNSELAALRESNTIHELEYLSDSTKKGIFSMKNYLGGKYALTCDEVIFERPDNLIIQESKNTSRSKMPSNDDIKDGLFKLILFSNISKLTLDGNEVKFKTRLKLTSNITGELHLPADTETIQKFAKRNQLTKSEETRIGLLNEEARENTLTIVLESNKRQYCEGV